LKKLIFILLFVLVGAVGLVLSPFILMFAADLTGRLINGPFSLCTVMDKAQLEAAIAKGFSVNAGCCAEHMMGECSIAKPNSTALVYAIEAGNSDAVQALLDRGADVNKPSDLGDALTTAAWHGRGNLVEALLNHGASSRSRITATRIAAHEGHRDIAVKILEHVAPEALPEACRDLFCGLVSDLQQRDSPKLAPQRELFLYAVRRCPDPNIVCAPFHLLSHLTGNDDNAPLVKALLEKGADLNAKEQSGKTVREFIRSHYDYESRPKMKALIDGP
jgi:hypothetical protein